jgi:hypothetical protein
LNNNINLINGLEVIVNDNLGIKERRFKWKLKWYQVPFNNFKRYKIIIRKKYNAVYLKVEGKLITNSFGLKAIKDYIENQKNK